MRPSWPDLQSWAFYHYFIEYDAIMYYLHFFLTFTTIGPLRMYYWRTSEFNYNYPHTYELPTNVLWTIIWHFNLLSCFIRNSHFKKFQRNQIQQWMLGIVNLNHAGNTTLLSCYQLLSNIILKEKNESGIVKVDYTANITHIETRLLRSCG